MKISIILVGLLTLVLCACAQTAYQPASGGGYGYREVSNGPGQYRVVFRSRGDDTARALDYAMLRAAELALRDGYDWFEVVSKETYVDREPVPFDVHQGLSTGYETYRTCGLLGCRTYARPATTYQTTVVLGNERSEVETVLAINLGKGVRPEGRETHDAREVFAHLNPDATAP